MLLSPQTLYLWGNSLSGVIPPSLGNCTKLTVIELESNQLTGPIPTELAMLLSLQTLNLWENSLSGVIPRGFGNCTKLTVIDLDSNQLTGPIPTELGMLLSVEISKHRLTQAFLKDSYYFITRRFNVGLM